MRYEFGNFKYVEKNNAIAANKKAKNFEFLL